MTFHKEYDDVFKFVKQAIDAKVRILLYYGDTDMMCNFLLGQEFSKNLNLPVSFWKVECVPNYSPGQK